MPGPDRGNGRLVQAMECELVDRCLQHLRTPFICGVPAACGGGLAGVPERRCGDHQPARPGVIPAVSACMVPDSLTDAMPG